MEKIKKKQVGLRLRPETLEYYKKRGENFKPPLKLSTYIEMLLEDVMEANKLNIGE